jgi:hypothetical protein
LGGIAESVLAAGPAAADTYLGLGIGTEAPITGDIGDSFDTTDSTHGRLVIGSRFGRLGLEGSLFGTEMTGGDAAEHAIAALGVDLKYHFGLSGPLEVYLKGGLHRAYLRTDESAELDEFEGNGYQIGAGIQYTFNLALTHASIWLDYNRSKFQLEDDLGRELEGTGKLLTIGLSVGI